MTIYILAGIFYAVGVIATALSMARWWRDSMENEPGCAAVLAALWPMVAIPVLLVNGLRWISFIALRIVPERKPAALSEGEG